MSQSWTTATRGKRSRNSAGGVIRRPRQRLAIESALARRGSWRRCGRSQRGSPPSGRHRGRCDRPGVRAPASRPRPPSPSAAPPGPTSPTARSIIRSTAGEHLGGMTIRDGRTAGTRFPRATEASAGIPSARSTPGPRRRPRKRRASAPSWRASKRLYGGTNTSGRISWRASSASASSSSSLGLGDGEPAQLGVATGRGKARAVISSVQSEGNTLGGQAVKHRRLGVVQRRETGRRGRQRLAADAWKHRQQIGDAGARHDLVEALERRRSRSDRDRPTPGSGETRRHV